MSEFSTEELFDAIDRIVRDLLARHGTDEPPVDALHLVQRAFGYSVEYAEEQDEEPQYGDRPRPKSRGRNIVFTPAQSEVAQQAIAARACARELIPTVLGKLGVVPGTEPRSGHNQMIALITPRLLLPTRWFDTAARKAQGDLAKLKALFPTVGYEMLALRLLDIDEPCLIAVVDDGVVSTRRSNFMAATKKLTAAELACVDKVQADEEPCTVRKDGWTARGWPIPTGPFNRIILRALPDEL